MYGTTGCSETQLETAFERMGCGGERKGNTLIITLKERTEEKKRRDGGREGGGMKLQ